MERKIILWRMMEDTKEKHAENRLIKTARKNTSYQVSNSTEERDVIELDYFVSL